jgi:uncharacterized protein YbjT (DUF2867 family)
MTNVLILGASGQIAVHVVRALRNHRSIHPTLFLRDTGKLSGIDTAKMRIVEGNAGNRKQILAAMKDQDVVYANLSGDVDVLARTIVAAMKEAGVKRLTFIASLGIYDEVPGKFGKWNRREIGSSLGPYKRAADLIEASGLDYTIIRPAWLTDNDEVAYETTKKGEPFKGTEVSRKSVAAYVMKILEDPAFANRSDVGIDKPGTEGDKPAFL